MSINEIDNEKGIGLVETILALGISVIVITSLVSLAVFTLRSSQQSKFLLEGSKLASEQIELVRLYKDSGITWATFTSNLNSTGCATNCYSNGTTVSTGKETVPMSNGAEVTRYFTTELNYGGNANIVRVTSVVEWKVGPSTKTTKVISDITNWRNQ